MKRNDKGLLVLCLFDFLLGQVDIFGLEAVGLSFYLASVPFLKWGIFQGLCLLLGTYVVRGGIGAYYNLVVVCVVVVCASIFRRKKPTVIKKLHNANVYGIIGAVVYMGTKLYGKGYGVGAKYCVNLMAVGVAVYGMTIIFSIGINYFMKCLGTRRPLTEEIISLAVIFFLGIKVINPMFGNLLSLEFTSIFLLILVAGHMWKSGIGAIVGIVGGSLCNMNHLSPDIEKILVTVGIFAIIGGVCGLLSDVSVFWGAGGHIVLVLFFYYAMEQNIDLAYMFDKRVTAAGVSAGIIYGIYGCFAKKKIIREDEIYEPRTAKYLAARRLKGYGDAFVKLSDSFKVEEEKRKVLGRSDMENVFKLLSENVCAGCDKIDSCWGENYYPTYGDTLGIIDNAWKNGKVDSGVMEFDIANKCSFFDKFVMQIEMAVEVARLNIRWMNRVMETKEAFRNQFREVAMVMNNASIAVDKPDLFTVEEKRKISDNLEEIGLQVQEIFGVLGAFNRLKLVVECKVKPMMHVTGKSAAMAVTMALGREFTMSEGKMSIGKELDSYSFYEEPNYKVMTGVARIAKSGEKDNGDNYSFTEIDSGEVVMLLCDGMGSGSTACIESKRVVELLENLMEAGFTWKCAVSFINAVYAWGGEGRDIYTLDMGLINLYTGMVSFVKEGAFATFIKRKNWVESISSISLPGGIFVGTQMDVVEKKLYNGDAIIMASDGVAQCLTKGEEVEEMEKIIGEITVTNPSQIASKIIEKCVESNDYAANDDMTVLVLSIWNK